MNPYKTLNVTEDASFDDIKKSYKSLAQKHHPDKNGDEETFKQIKEAFEILSDPIRRKQYDETGTTSTEKSIEEKAIDELANLFFHTIYNYDMNNSNLIDVMKNLIEERNRSLIDQKNSIDVEIKNLLDLTKKITVKLETENLLNQFLDHQIENLNKRLESIKQSVEVNHNMLERLADYHYKIN